MGEVMETVRKSSPRLSEDLTFRLTFDDEGTSIEECWLEEAVERFRSHDHDTEEE